MLWFITGCYVFCGLSLWFGFKEKWIPAGVLKVLASLIFILLAIDLELFTSNPWFGTGLLLCFIGDACLTVSGKGKTFNTGLISFLGAHLCFALAFINLGLDNQKIFYVTLTVIFSATFLASWLLKSLSGLHQKLVSGYLVVIATMVITASSINSIHSGYWLIMTGAILFALSDIFVAVNRFKNPAFLNRLIGLPLYYTAQILIILGFNKML